MAKQTSKPSKNLIGVFWDKLFTNIHWTSVVTDKLNCRVYAPVEPEPNMTERSVASGRWRIPCVLVTAVPNDTKGVHLRQLRSEVMNIDEYLLGLLKHYVARKPLPTFKFQSYRVHRKGQTVRLETFRKWARTFGYTPLVYTNEESPYTSFVFGAKVFKAQNPHAVIKQKGETELLTLLSTFQVGADDVLHFHTVTLSRTLVRGIVKHVTKLLDVAATRKTEPTVQERKLN